MPDSDEIDANLQRLRERVVHEFRNPDFELFGVHYGCPPPDHLRQLYGLRESLTATPVEVELPNGPLHVQCFIPLARPSILGGSRYAWTFYPFACGYDGEALLLEMSNSDVLFVDHAGDGTDVEATSVSVEELLEELTIALADNG